MKILVTGASGYVGGMLSRHFREQGHEIISLSRRPCTGSWTAYSLADTDPRALPWEGADVLVHAAHDFKSSSREENHTRNILPTFRLFQAAAAAQVPHLVLISSMSAYPNCGSLYGNAKLETERELIPFNPLIIRPGLVWGGETGGVMGSLEKLVLLLPLVPFVTAKSSLKQFLVHGTDLAQIILQLIHSNPSPETPVIASAFHPQSVPLPDILREIARRHSLRRSYLPVPWQLAMLGLKSLETLGIPLPFRSDSLKGLVHPNPTPKNHFLDFTYTPFVKER
jgi:nucleoside-diphosphate-sugar epimerase